MLQAVYLAADRPRPPSPLVLVPGRITSACWDDALGDGSHHWPLNSSCAAMVVASCSSFEALYAAESSCGSPTPAHPERVRACLRLLSEKVSYGSRTLLLINYQRVHTDGVDGIPDRDRPGTVHLGVSVLTGAEFCANETPLGHENVLHIFSHFDDILHTLK